MLSTKTVTVHCTAPFLRIITSVSKKKVRKTWCQSYWFSSDPTFLTYTGNFKRDEERPGKPIRPWDPNYISQAATVSLALVIKAMGGPSTEKGLLPFGELLNLIAYLQFFLPFQIYSSCIFAFHIFSSILLKHKCSSLTWNRDDMTLM